MTPEEARTETLRAFLADFLGVQFTYPDAEALLTALRKAD
jgi:hypothetical protein